MMQHSYAFMVWWKNNCKLKFQKKDEHGRNIMKGSFGLHGGQEKEDEGQRKRGKERAERWKERERETMCSAVGNYSRRLAEKPSERDRQRDKLIIIIFSMLVVITIIIMAINITVTTVTATEKSWRAQPALDQSDSANCVRVCVRPHACTTVCVCVCTRVHDGDREMVVERKNPGAVQQILNTFWPSVWLICLFCCAVYLVFYFWTLLLPKHCTNLYLFLKD